MNTSYVAHEPEPVRLEPLQHAIEALYAKKSRATWPAELVRARSRALVELGLENARVGFDDLRLAHPRAAATARAARWSTRSTRGWTSARSRRRRRSSFCVMAPRSMKPACARSCRCIRPGAVWKDVAAQLSQFRAGTRRQPVVGAESAAVRSGVWRGVFSRPDVRRQRLEGARRAGDHFRNLGYVFELRVRRVAHRACRRAECRVFAASAKPFPRRSRRRCSISARAARTHDAWLRISKLA